jgi:hypothetical protein
MVRRHQGNLLLRGIAMSGTTPHTPLSAAVVVVDGFLPEELAVAMRGDIETHFADHDADQVATRQLWDYRFAPGLHAYLQTSPETIIREDHLDAFMRAIQTWSIATLGMGNLAWPSLCLYVGGCRQAMRNDAAAGRFGFVYSLTRDQCRTAGGRMLALREADVRDRMLGAASAEGGFYDVIEPKFNRLVLLDDRLPYAIEPIEGSMDPLEGRLVLHGHLSETGTISTGNLPNEVVEETLVELYCDFAERNSARIALYQGPLVLRFVVDASGSVATCDVLVDRVLHGDPRHAEWEPLRADLVNRIKRLKFPPARDQTAVTKPLVFGVPLPGTI